MIGCKDDRYRTDEGGNQRDRPGHDKNVAFDVRKASLAVEMRDIDGIPRGKADHQRVEQRLVRSRCTHGTERKLANALAGNDSVDRAVGLREHGGKDQGKRVQDHISVDVALRQIFGDLHCRHPS